jgi:hypothetical protein
MLMSGLACPNPTVSLSARDVTGPKDMKLSEVVEKDDGNIYLGSVEPNYVGIEVLLRIVLSHMYMYIADATLLREKKLTIHKKQMLSFFNLQIAVW